MTGTFAQAATRLAGLACRALGWRPADFWQATPAELATIFAGDDGEPEAPLSRGEFEALMKRDRDG